MKALVTGGTGIIGANLVRALLAAGWQVRALVRPGPPRRALLGLPVETCAGDVLDPASLATAAAGADVVFHAAARFSYGVAPAELDRLAVDGTRNVVVAAAAAGAGRVVLTSSSVIFGSSAHPEARTEAARLSPEDASAYALSKLRQSAAGFAAAAAAGIDLVAVCPTLSVGAWDYSLAESSASLVRYLNDPFRSTFDGGCNIVAAADIARAHLLVAERGAAGTSYLAGSENLHWRDVHTAVSGLCGTYGPLLAATHTGAYLTAVWSELAVRGTGAGPTLTRDQVRMIGRFYWYDDARIRALGYRPAPARDALAEALRWLLRTDHLRADVRSALRLTGRLAPAEATAGRPLKAR